MGNIKSLSNFFAMYVDGFKNLTWGKPLWILILIKLFIMFAILKVFFFPNILNRFDTEKEKSEFVLKELTNKHSTNEKQLPNESD
ncbi:DUF4492 domain-containing protein [Bacteroidia bacterium]|nr:DUF4492 domain-containing protein [Bacteroidia bacterium]